MIRIFQFLVVMHIVTISLEPPAPSVRAVLNIGASVLINVNVVGVKFKNKPPLFGGGIFLQCRIIERQERRQPEEPCRQGRI